jgi:hypothetical protein
MSSEAMAGIVVADGRVGITLREGLARAGAPSIAGTAAPGLPLTALRAAAPSDAVVVIVEAGRNTTKK